MAAVDRSRNPKRIPEASYDKAAPWKYQLAEGGFVRHGIRRAQELSGGQTKITDTVDESAKKEGKSTADYIKEVMEN